MKIADFLVLEGTEIDFKATGKSSAIRRMCKTLTASSKVTDQRKLLKDILIREEIESTGIGDGIALPHARTDSVSEPVISIAVSKKGIDFDALDSRPVFIFFLIAVPNNQSKLLLKLLAKITQFLKRTEVKEEFINARNLNDIQNILKKE